MADDTPPPPPALTDADILFEARRDPATRLLLEKALRGEGNYPDVLYSILNRARQSGQSVKDVLLSKGQFDALDPKLGDPRLRNLTEAQLGPEAALIDRPLGQFNPNMTYFYNRDLLAKKHAEDPVHYPNLTPKFAVGKTPVASQGNQLFFEGQYKGGPLMATSTATGPTDSSAVNQAIGAMPGPDFSAGFQLTPEQSERVRSDEAQITALQPKVRADIEAMGPEYDKQLQEVREGRARADALYQRYNDTMQDLYDSMPDQHKMEIDELRKVSSEPGSPSRVLGQWLPMLAVIGGAFTKAGAIGSLGAAADAMNAARSHDDEALKRADDQFHNQLAETIDKGNMALSMLSQSIAKTQGDNAATLEEARITGLKLGISSLVQASYQQDVNAVYATQAALAKGLNEASNLQLRSYKIREAMVKAEVAEQALKDGKHLSDAEVWALAVKHSNGGTLPPLAWTDATLKNRIAKAESDYSLNPTWDGPWGVGPQPSDWKDGDPPQTPAVGGQPVATGGQPASAAQPAAAAPTQLTPTQAGIQGATVQGDVKADRASQTNAQKLADASQTQEQTASANFKRALDRAPKGVVYNAGPWIEDWIQRGAIALGNPDVPPYWVDLLTAADEYAKIIAGATGTAGSTDEARRQSLKMFKPGFTVEQMTNAVHEAEADMANRVQSNVDARERINKRMNDERGAGGVAAAAQGAQPAPTAAAPQPQGLTKESDRELWKSREEKLIKAKRDGTLHEGSTPDAIRRQFRAWFPDATDAAINRTVNTIEAAK